MQFEFKVHILPIDGVSVLEKGSSLGQVYQLTLVLKSLSRCARTEERFRRSLDAAKLRVKETRVPLVMIDWPVDLSPGRRFSVQWLQERLEFVIPETPGRGLQYFPALKKAALVPLIVEFSSKVQPCHFLSVQHLEAKGKFSGQEHVDVAFFWSKSRAEWPDPRSLKPFTFSATNEVTASVPAVLDLSRTRLPPVQSCVLCGGSPKESTREHIVPEWVRSEVAKEFGRCDGLTAPACDPCNKKAGKLEDTVKSISSKYRHKPPMPPALHSTISTYMVYKTETICKTLGFDIEQRNPIQFSQLFGTDLTIPAFFWYYRVDDSTGPEWGCALSMGWWLAAFATEESSGKLLLKEARDWAEVNMVSSDR